MKIFTLTKKAKADLKSIAAYTQKKWGKDQRKTYLRQFDDTFHMLLETPELGNKCDFIKLGPEILIRQVINTLYSIGYDFSQRTNIDTFFTL